jgi:hypothetical protein
LGAVGNIINSITHLGDLINGLFNTLMNLLNTLKDGLLTGIQALFVPSNDCISSNIDGFQNHFKFITAFKGIGDFIQDFKNTTEAPSIEADLGAYSRNDYKFGGKVKFIDMSWYTPFKSIGDGIITAFVYIFFAWNVYRKLPDIIQGASMSESFNAARMDKDRSQAVRRLK